jgi:hypothetical protein
VTAGARNSSARYGVVYRDPRLRAVLLNGGLTPVAGPFEVTPGEISQLERPTAVTFDPDSQVYYATWIDEISSANFSLNITAWERDGAVSLPSQPLGQMFASAASATINAYAAALMVPGGVTPELWLTWPPAV